jgi:hypothetical protein
MNYLNVMTEVMDLVDWWLGLFYILFLIDFLF